MSEIILPQKIIFGKSSLKDNPFSDFSSAILICDCKNFLKSNPFFTDDNSKPKLIPEIVVKTDESTQVLADFAAEQLNSGKFDLLIAAGSGTLFDRATELAVDYSVKLALIPVCGLTESHLSPPEPPYAAVLVPSLICGENAIATAYRASASLAVCIDAFLHTEDEVMRSLISDTAVQIEQNMVSAYHGEIAALFKIYYAIFAADIIAYSFNDETPFRKAVLFFSELGAPHSGSAAVCLANSLEFSASEIEDKCAELSMRFGINKNCGDSAGNLAEFLRKKFASVGIQKSVNAFYSDEWRYTEKADGFNELRPLLDNCYYGSRRFVRL